MVLVLFGPPGCGKGTQGMRLRERYGVPSISTGDILRDAVRDRTRLGRKAQSYMDKGKLVPDTVVLGLIGDRLADADTAEGFILDGFPRTITQATGLEDLLRELGHEIRRVVNLVVDRDVLLERLTSRRVCTRCGGVFNTISLPAPPEGICQDASVACSGEDIVQRPDDSRETAERRLDVYEEETRPVLGYYEGLGLLANVDGEGSPEAVFDRIQREAA